MYEKTVLVVALLMTACLLIPFGVFVMSGRKAPMGKKMIVVNIVSFFAILIGAFAFTANGAVLAEGEAAVAMGYEGMQFLAAALSTGLAAIGAGIAVASASSAALGAISENPGAMGKSLIFVALAEGIALYGLLISFTILGK